MLALSLFLVACGNQTAAPAYILPSPTPHRLIASLSVSPLATSTPAQVSRGGLDVVLPAVTADPAFCLPGTAALARQYGARWEQHADPTIRPLIDFQRTVGLHAEVVGWNDEAPNSMYPNPRVVIMVLHWDGSDLFALGLPRRYHGKPVVIDAVNEIPTGEPVYAPGAAHTPAPLPTPLPGCAGSTDGPTASAHKAPSTSQLLPLAFGDGRVNSVSCGAKAKIGAPACDGA